MAAAPPSNDWYEVINAGTRLQRSQVRLTRVSTRYQVAGRLTNQEVTCGNSDASVRGSGNVPEQSTANRKVTRDTMIA